MRAPALAVALVLAPAALLLGSGAASAEDFESAAKAAKPIHDLKGMTSLFWSADVSCGSIKNDLLRRQCTGVRSARQRSVYDEVYLVDAHHESFDIETDPKKNSVRVDLRSCIWCTADGPVVIGKGNHAIEAGKVHGAIIGEYSKQFKNADEAAHWAQYVAARLRGQFLVKIPKNLDEFKAGGHQGYKVQIVGHRLYDPCSGDVLSSYPQSKGRGPLAPSTCEGVPEYVPNDPDLNVEPEIVHPDRLSTAQIKAAMKEVELQTKACHDAYGIEGMATFKLIIAGSGKIKESQQTGDFKGTPTGICLDKAIQAASFPKSKKKATPVTYPIVLR